MTRMQRFALTGGIASGKSSVARLLARRQVPVVDADALYHALIAPNGGAPSPLAHAIGDAFPGSLNGDGSLNRPALAARIFARPQDKQKLEAIAHPKVAEKAEEAMALLASQGHRLAVYDIPLLYERDLAHRYDGVIVVWVPADVQRIRLRERDGLNPQAAEARIASQMPLDEKRRRADVVFDNSGGKEALQSQVDYWLDGMLSSQDSKPHR